MTRVRPEVGIDVRPYRDEDEPAVLRLLTASLGDGPAGTRDPEFFRWKHNENPFGRSFMLVAEAGGEIVGLRAFLRWRFRAGNRVVHAVRAVDTATHPAFQGGGIFTRLTLDALDALRGEVDFVFNTPNEKSLPGYLKMGWRRVGDVPIRIGVRRPVRFLTGLTGARTTADRHDPERAVVATAAWEVLGDSRLESLVAVAPSDLRLATSRDRDYLRWRYARAPLLDYRAVVEEDAGRLAGVGVFRVRRRGRLREATLAELLVDPSRRGVGRRLVRRVGAVGGVDHVAYSFPNETPAARSLRGATSFPAPGGMSFVANPLREHLAPDPTLLSSWALTLGDLEVF